MRIRLGFEKNASIKNAHINEKLQKKIVEQIDDITERVDKLKEEQEKDIIRKFNSELAKMKKKMEERKTSKGDSGADQKEREAELQHHLELITNIAQRIDNENRTLLKKNQELRSEYRAQEQERGMLVKQLVLQKKENAKVREQIEIYNRLIDQKQEEEGIDENIELDGLDEEPIGGKGLARKRSQLNTRGSNRSQK